MEWLPACNPDDVPIDRLVAGELFTKKNTLKKNCTDALTPNVIFLHTQQMLEGTRQVASICLYVALVACQTAVCTGVAECEGEDPRSDEEDTDLVVASR